MERFLGNKKKSKKEEKVVGLTRRQLLKGGAGLIAGGIIGAKYGTEAKAAEKPKMDDYQEAIKAFKNLDINFWRKLQVEVGSIETNGDEDLESLKADAKHLSEVIDQLLAPTSDAGVEDLDTLLVSMRAIKPLIENIEANPAFNIYAPKATV